MKMKIVADSSADLLKIDGVDYQSVPLTLRTAEREFVDDEKNNVYEMVEYLSHYKGKSGSACPGTQDWLDSFGDADVVFCVTITSNLSGCYNSALVAKAEYEEEHPDRKVYVIDSLSTGPEMQLIIENMIDSIHAGKEPEEVYQTAMKYKEKTALLFALQSLTNLANNGRVSHSVAKIAGVLGIRVLGKASEIGTIEVVSKYRGDKKLMLGIEETMEKIGYKGGKLRISHCFNEEMAQKLADVFKKKYPKLDCIIRPSRGLCSFYAEKGGLLIGFEC